jgi:hypothetical protein
VPRAFTSELPKISYAGINNGIRGGPMVRGEWDVKESLPGMAAGVLLLMVLSGCQTIQGPNWYHAGPAPHQQFWAQVFDPFPEDEIAPPVDGGRPREFDRAPPEIDRARHYARPPRW